MNQVLQYAPANVLVVGENRGERSLSVVRRATQSALTACMGMGGKVGKEIRSNVAQVGLVDVAQQAANGNYKPLAETLAIRTGEPFIISNRSTFEALPDMMQARIESAKLGKNGGMRESKDGILVPGAKLKLAIELHALCVGVVERAKNVAEARKAGQVGQAELYDLCAGMVERPKNAHEERVAGQAEKASIGE